MKKLLSDRLHHWLLSFFFACTLLSMSSWLLSWPAHLGRLAFALLIWTLLLTAAEGFGRGWGVLLLLAFSEGLLLLFCDRAALWDYVINLLGGAKPVSGTPLDLLLLMSLLPFTTAAHPLLNRLFLRTGLSILWTAFWITAALLEWGVPKLALASMVPLLLYTLAEALHALRHPGERGGFGDLSAGLVALFAAGTLVLLLPTSQKPYGFPILHGIWDRVEVLAHNVETRLFFREGGSEEFGMAMGGFSEDALTGSGVKDGEEQWIVAQSRYDSDGALYLAGNRWNRFTGDSWENTLSEEEAVLGWRMDTAEHIYAFWRFQRETEEPMPPGDYFRENNVYLGYRRMNIRTLFGTENLLLIRTEEKRYPYAETPAGLRFDYVQSRDAWVRLYYLEENHRFMDEVISAAEGYTYGTRSNLIWYDVAGNYRSRFRLDMENGVKLEEDLAERQSLIEENYLSIEGLSEKARDLALEIAAREETDYGCIRAVERYLREHYRYTTTPEAVPPGASLVDTLLFDTGEGYCTWYATTATLLLRSLGIPARYVQGYRIPLTGGETRFLEGKDSHAWCEAYLPGYGWLTVEATPGYGIDGRGWGGTGGTTSGSSSGNGQGEEMWEEEITASQALSSDPGGEEETSARSSWTHWLLPGVGIALLVMLQLCLALFWFKHQRNYERADYTKRTVMDLEEILRILGRRGYARRPDESLNRYFKRISWSPLGLNREETMRMAQLYDEMIFGERTISLEQWQASHQYLEKIRRLRRSRPSF